MKTITASVVCYLISKEITGRGFGLLPMADDHSTTSYPNEVDDKLYWKCFYCLYENPADSMLCSICKRYPSDKTEYLTLSEWSQKNYSQSPSFIQPEEQRRRIGEDVHDNFTFNNQRYPHFSGRYEQTSPNKRSTTNQSNTKRLLKSSLSLNEEKLEIANRLILMNYDEWLAVESAKENSTFEMALLACKQHVKKTKRIRELVVENLLSNEKDAGMAVTLMDLGHPRNMSIKAARSCKNIQEAQRFIADHFLIGNRCFAKSKLKEILDTLKPEEREMPANKLDIVGKLMLIGHNKQNALSAAKMFDTLDQAKQLCMEQLDFQKRVEDMVQEEILPNTIKASLAIQLIDLKYSKKYAILAARECNNLEEAKKYLETECTICLNVFPQSEMITMLYCHHCCCRHCTKSHFTVSIREKSIYNILCPVCNEPNLKDVEIARNYFMYLSELLQTIVEPNVIEILQNKMKDYILANNPEYLQCPACHEQSLFEVDPQGRRLQCPRCNCKICAQCKLQWEDNHEGNSCKQFAILHRIEVSNQSKDDINTFIQNFYISCPQCKFCYEFIRGGCMHLSCHQCKYEFCICCKKPFVSDKCRKSEKCKTMGLHAHHPRYCLYFWRDQNVKHLKKLLDMHNIIYDIDYIKSGEDKNDLPGCRIKEETDIDGRLRADVCGKLVDDGQAGLCKVHYNEYLVYLIIKHRLDPARIMKPSGLTNELVRHQKDIPQKLDEETEDNYLCRLRNFVMEHIPLFA